MSDDHRQRVRRSVCDCMFCGEIFVSPQGTPRSVCDSCMSVLFSTYKEKETLASTQERFLK